MFSNFFISAFIIFSRDNFILCFNYLLVATGIGNLLSFCVGGLCKQMVEPFIFICCPDILFRKLNLISPCMSSFNQHIVVGTNTIFFASINTY